MKWLTVIFQIYGLNMQSYEVIVIGGGIAGVSAVEQVK